MVGLGAGVVEVDFVLARLQAVGFELVLGGVDGRVRLQAPRRTRLRVTSTEASDRGSGPASCGAERVVGSGLEHLGDGHALARPQRGSAALRRRTSRGRGLPCGALPRPSTTSSGVWSPSTRISCRSEAASPLLVKVISALPESALSRCAELCRFRQLPVSSKASSWPLSSPQAAKRKDGDHSKRWRREQLGSAIAWRSGSTPPPRLGWTRHWLPAVPLSSAPRACASSGRGRATGTAGGTPGSAPRRPLGVGASRRRGSRWRRS